MNKPKVKLTGTDGNAFAVLGKCLQALKNAGYSLEKIQQFNKEAASGDYNNLLKVAMEWLEVE